MRRIIRNQLAVDKQVGISRENHWWPGCKATVFDRSYRCRTNTHYINRFDHAISNDQATTSSSSSAADHLRGDACNTVTDPPERQNYSGLNCRGQQAANRLEIACGPPLPSSPPPPPGPSGATREQSLHATSPRATATTANPHDDVSDNARGRRTRGADEQHRRGVVRERPTPRRRRRGVTDDELLDAAPELLPGCVAHHTCARRSAAKSLPPRTLLRSPPANVLRHAIGCTLPPTRAHVMSDIPPPPPPSRNNDAARSEIATTLFEIA